MNDWTDELTLLAPNGHTRDGSGNQVVSYESSTISATKKPIAMSEFYAAAQSGIRPELKLIVHPFEFDGQELVEYDGTRYSLIRTYQTSYDEMEIYLERKVGVQQ